MLYNYLDYSLSVSPGTHLWLREPDHISATNLKQKNLDAEDWAPIIGPAWLIIKILCLRSMPYQLIKQTFLNCQGRSYLYTLTKKYCILTSHYMFSRGNVQIMSKHKNSCQSYLLCSMFS